MVHGLGAELVAPDWPPLTVEEIFSLAADFPALEGAAEQLWLSPRPWSSAAVVTVADGRRFVKRHHHRVRSPASLAEEHAYLAHLSGRGLPVPRVEPTRSGATSLRRGAWVYEVHTVLDGADRYRDAPSWTPLADVAQARAAGAALARVHEASATWPHPARREALLLARPRCALADDPLRAIRRRAERRRPLATALAGYRWERDLRLLRRWARAGAVHRRSPGGRPWPVHWCHNDWHASNLLWADEPQVVGIFDFGLADRVPVTYDLATAIERNAVDWLSPAEQRQAFPRVAVTLLAGYHEVRPLAPGLVHAIAALLPLVHVDLLLSELEYYGGLLHSKTGVAAAYEVLVDHAAWFGTGSGAELLQCLRDFRPGESAPERSGWAPGLNPAGGDGVRH